MAVESQGVTRRDALTVMGVWGTAAAADAATSGGSASIMGMETGLEDLRRGLQRIIDQTPIVDTHEHLPDEHERLGGEGVRSFGSSDCGCASHLFRFPEDPMNNGAFVDTVLHYRMGRLMSWSGRLTGAPAGRKKR